MQISPAAFNTLSDSAPRQIVGQLWGLDSHHSANKVIAFFFQKKKGQYDGDGEDKGKGAGRLWRDSELLGDPA